MTSKPRKFFYLAMSFVGIGLAASCDDPAPEIADRDIEEAETPLEPGSADEPLVCEVGGSEAAMAIHWAALHEKSALIESATGDVQIELVNHTKDDISVVPVLQVQQRGILATTELPVANVPAASTTVVKFSLADSAAADPQPLAPATLLVGVRIVAGSEPGVLWGPVAYAHMSGESLLVYREERLRSDFANGDLSGALAEYGIDPGSTQFVDGGAGFAN